MNLIEESLQQQLQQILQAHGYSNNADIRKGYAEWQQFIQEKYQQAPSELLRLCVVYVERLHSALAVDEYTIHYVEEAQEIANLYRDNVEQRADILSVLNELLVTGESYFAQPRLFKDFMAKGMFELKKILERTQEFWDLQQLYHEGEFAFPMGLLTLLDRYIALFDPYQALNYEERKPLLKDLQLQIVKQYPEEILNLFLFAIEHDAYFHYWVSKKLFFVLMEQKDKRLNQPEILEKLVQNYALIIKKMIYAKPFILHLAFSITKLAKAQQLNASIVETMRHIVFTEQNTQSIPKKRLEQIQQQVQEIACAFQSAS